MAQIDVHLVYIYVLLEIVIVLVMFYVSRSKVLSRLMLFVALYPTLNKYLSCLVLSRWGLERCSSHVYCISFKLKSFSKSSIHIPLKNNKKLVCLLSSSETPARHMRQGDIYLVFSGAIPYHNLLSLWNFRKCYATPK